MSSGSASPSPSPSSSPPTGPGRRRLTGRCDSSPVRSASPPGARKPPPFSLNDQEDRVFQSRDQRMHDFKLLGSSFLTGDQMPRNKTTEDINITSSPPSSACEPTSTLFNTKKQSSSNPPSPRPSGRYPVFTHRTAKSPPTYVTPPPTLLDGECSGVIYFHISRPR